MPMDALMQGPATFRIGTVLNRTFGVIGRNFGKVLVLFLITYGLRTGITLGLVYALTSSNPQPALGLVGTAYAASGLRLLVDLVVGSFFLGSITALTFGDLSGQRVPLGAAMMTGLRHLGPLFLLRLVIWISVAVCCILLIVPGIIVALRWFVATEVRVVEGAGFGRALSRSVELTRGNRWKLLGLVFIYGVFYLLIGGVPTYLAATGKVYLLSGGWTYGISAIGAVVGAVSTVSYATAYTELRRVTEGGFTAQLAAVFA